MQETLGTVLYFVNQGITHDVFYISEHVAETR